MSTATLNLVYKLVDKLVSLVLLFLKRNNTKDTKLSTNLCTKSHVAVGVTFLRILLPLPSVLARVILVRKLVS